MVNPNKDPNRRVMSQTKDIIDEWVIRTGKPRELLEEMYVLHTKYVKKLTRETPDALNIRLPALGVLRMNRYLSVRYHTLYDKTNDVLNAKLKILDDITKEHGWDFLNFKIPMFRTQYWKIFKNKADAMLQRFYTIIKLIEDVNNEQFNKKHRSSY